jgi:hypothetical protein
MKTHFSQMHDEEASLFFGICLDNGSSKEEAFKDTEMIDNLLSIQRMRFIHFKVQYTEKGFLRKNSSFSSMIDRAVEARLQEDKQ